jgi:hypothetical protein
MSWDTPAARTSIISVQALRAANKRFEIALTTGIKGGALAPQSASASRQVKAQPHPIARQSC